MRDVKTLIAGCLLGLSACTPLVLAPGAADVRLTNVSADVVNCASVGNIRVPKDGAGMADMAHAVGQLKNQTIGLGGNVAFITEGTPAFPAAGVAYRCPPQSARLATSAAAGSDSIPRSPLPPPAHTAGR
jgi:hypothetical protein